MQRGQRRRNRAHHGDMLYPYQPRVVKSVRDAESGHQANQHEGPMPGHAFHHKRGAERAQPHNQGTPVDGLNMSDQMVQDAKCRCAGR
ncbi:hypothetical protein D3C72_1505940 [compost metagenome]